MKVAFALIANFTTRLMIIAMMAIALVQASFLTEAHGAVNKPPRILKFTGVPMAQGLMIKNKFPYVFERPVTLAEVDEIVVFLMGTKIFSNVEVVERDATGGGRELVLIASVLRQIKSINVTGNSVMSTDEIETTLHVSPGQAFERKNLLNSADELRLAYQRLGYHNAQVEIDFNLPDENEIGVNVKVIEGLPLVMSQVSVEASNTELSGHLEHIAMTLKGKVLTEDELLDFSKKAGDYLHDHRYLTARLSSPAISYNQDRTQAKLIYTIENPWRVEFKFTGNQYFSDGSIISDLESVNLAGATSSPAPDMAERIRRMYQASGYANVEVEYTENLNPSRQLIAFVIIENPRVKIKKIEIAGNVSRPENYYTQFIKSSSSDLTGDGYYNRHDIDEGGKRLMTELQNQGYLRAKILSSRAEFTKDKSGVTIYLNIDEGPLTQIRQIRMEGVEAFPKAQLLEQLKIKSGAALSLKDLEDSIQAVKDFYHSQGYLEMKITNESERNRIVTYNDTNTQATIDLKVYEGPRVIVASITLDGNTFTKDYVILRELRFKVGDVLTPDKLNDSIFRLNNLGLFSNVNIHMVEEGSSVSERSIVVKIAESKPGLFQSGVGINNERDLTYRGYLGVAYRNIEGTGRALSFRVDPKFSTDPRIDFLQNKETLSYLEPYLTSPNDRGRINLVRDQSFYDYYPAHGAIIQETDSLTFLVERDLARHIKLTYTAYSIATIRQFISSSYPDNESNLRYQNIGKVGAQVEWDYRDNIFIPTQGTDSYVNLQYSDPVIGSSRDNTQTIKFVKATAGTTWYNRLFGMKDLVWANSVRGGYVSNMSEDLHAGVPSQEDFFLGGRTTIRGFDASENERIPSLIDLQHAYPGLPDLTLFNVTSDSYFYLLKTEVRFPISKSFFMGELGGLVFYDGGSVILSQLALPTPYRDSAGVGLTVATAVGQLVAEIGWKLNRRLLQVGNGTTTFDIRESPWAFDFSIGTF
jgi:outer membrane protein assembly complex protein YaeT